MQPCATWSDDCQGKKDYDGRLLDISTRYWPGSDGGGTMIFDTITCEFGSLPYGARPSARSSILLRHGVPDQYGYGDYLIWRSAKFEADTEAEVKDQVQKWVAAQMADVIALLGGLAAFRKP
jgi:hypothetical protein